MSDGTNVKLSFEGLIPKDGKYLYYAGSYDGYLGFDFVDMGLITRAGIEFNGLEGTGFSSVLHGDAEAFTGEQNIDVGYYGRIISSYARETFTLKSGIFASYRGTQNTSFYTFNANGNKAEVTISLGETATKIDFANYGRDFRNITQVELGAQGRTATSTIMDNLRVHWNGAIPGSGAMKHHVHVSHPRLVGMGSNSAAGHSGFGQTGANGQHNAGYHGELASLVSLTHHGGGLTAEFSLPQAEHFGT